MSLLTNQLIKFGLIQEMKDWEQHFINGTKGMPKVDPKILNYVKGLLAKVYEGNEERVQNNPLAPWLVLTVAEIGPAKINTQTINKLKVVIEYVKLTNNIGNIKASINKGEVTKTDLDTAATYAEEKVNKIKQKEAEKAQANGGVKADLKPDGYKDVFAFNDNGQNPGNIQKQEEIALREDEKKGLIKRIWATNDGSGRIWVQVLNTKWLSQKCEVGNRNWEIGMGCQSVTFASNDYVNFQFIGPPKGNKNGKYSTIIGCAVRTDNKAIAEVKQEGNIQPGTSASSQGYTDSDQQLVDFLSNCPEAIKSAKYFGDYYGNMDFDKDERNLGHGYGLHGGGVGFLYHIAKTKPDLAARLFEARPDILEGNKQLLVALFGTEWVDSINVDISELAQNKPIDFLNRLEELIKRYGKDAIDLLNKINIEAIAQKYPDLILNNLGSFVGNISIDRFTNLIKSVDFNKYIVDRKDAFENLVRNMANVPDYKNLFKTLVYDHSEDIIKAFGNGGKGIMEFLKFTASPRLRQHIDAKRDSETGEFIGIRKKLINPGVPEDEKIYEEEEFIIPDNLKILSQKERRDFITKNKEYIKSLIKTDELGKEVNYLRYLFSESNRQDIERTLQNEKEQFIEYYENKFSKGDQKNVMIGGKLVSQGYMPGIFEFYAALNKNVPGGIVRNQNQIYVKMDLNDAQKYRKSIIRYYYEQRKKNEQEEVESNTTYGKDNILYKQQIQNELKNKETQFRYGAAKDYVITLELSGMNEDQLSNYYLEAYKPENMGVARSQSLYIYLSVLKEIMTPEKAIAKIKEMREEIINSSPNGKAIFQKLTDEFYITKFDVQPNQFVEFTGELTEIPMQRWFNPLDVKKKADDVWQFSPYLTPGRKYKVIDVKNYDGIENGAVLIFDEGQEKVMPQERWFKTQMFKVKIVKYLPSEDNKINEMVLRKLISKKLNLENDDSKKKRPIAYTAIILDSSSIKKLQNFTKEMIRSKKMINQDGWTMSSDHVTINMGPAQSQTLIGENVEIKVLKYAFDENVAAVSVVINKNGEEIEFEKSLPHITLAYNEVNGAMAKMSNNLTNWKPVPKSFILSGTIKQVQGQIV